MPQIENFIDTLKAPASQLLKEGVDPLFIMAALAEIIVDVAKTDRNFAATHLESVGAILKGKRGGDPGQDGDEHGKGNLPMTTHLQAVLRSMADTTLFSGRGDDKRDGMWYLLNGFDCLLARTAEALVKDGVDRETIMGLFVSHAQEVLDRGAEDVPDAGKNAGLVVQRALRQQSIYD